MASFKTLYRHLCLPGLLIIAAGCSVEKNTDSTRFYHSMTARYNIYFNGYESFKAGLNKISLNYTDDFAEILNVFEFSDPAVVSMVSSDMEGAVQKASKLISLKSITAKPEIKSSRELSQKEKDLLDRKEYNEWVDDSYYLISMARFYMHQFDEASALFSYCIAEASDPDIRTESSIWLARVYSEKENYTEAQRILREITIEENSPKRIKAMYNTTQADIFVKQKLYAEAIDPLAEALKHISGKRNRYRLTYLLAQLCGQTGNGARATTLYRDVVKMNPPYEVEFNARINMAGVFDVNSGNPDDIRKELQKMLRDTKNKDFEDQIYYALGNLSMKEGKEDEAIDYYSKSAQAATRNQNQKGRSFLTLADYYYSVPDYMKAGMYYDSAIFFIEESHPDYEAISSKSQNLNALVTQLVTIQTEDSLQRVALMSAADRNKVISGIIEELKKGDNTGTGSEYADRINLGQYYENERRFQDNIAQSGNWYFYNQAALSFGRTEFRRRWGDRKLEDNWRRANRARINLAQIAPVGEDGEPVPVDSLDPSTDPRNPEYYMRTLPMSDSLLAVSDEKISFAMLNAGIAFSDRIHDTIKAVEMFGQLVDRYPENEVVAEALYHLYLITRPSNKTQSEAYRQKLLEEFPGSEFAAILSDPDYYTRTAQKMAASSYEQAYALYSSERFADAIAAADAALLKYPKDPLAPRFMLLKAYCVARISDERTFKEELGRLIDAWPGTEESKRAGEIVAFLNQAVPELKIEEDKQAASVLYTADKNAPHVFALVISDPAFNINLATFDVISYNIDNFTNKNYRTEGSVTDNKYIIITVSGFADYGEALGYYQAFNAGSRIRNPSGIRMYNFLISTGNLQILATDRKPDVYRLFFEENYLK